MPAAVDFTGLAWSSLGFFPEAPTHFGCDSLCLGAIYFLSKRDGRLGFSKNGLKKNPDHENATNGRKNRETFGL